MTLSSSAFSAGDAWHVWSEAWEKTDKLPHHVRPQSHTRQRCFLSRHMTGHLPPPVKVRVIKVTWQLGTWASAHRGKWGQLTPLEKNEWKIKKRKHAKKSSFLCLCYILRADRAGRCRERRCADHIFIQIYFRMHYFVVKFSKFSSPQAARGHWPPNQNPADVPG